MQTPEPTAVEQPPAEPVQQVEVHPKLTREEYPWLWNQLKLDDPEAVQRLVDGYFDGCASQREPVTLMGLALALNVDRTTLFRYARGDGGRDQTVCNILARACAQVAKSYELSPYVDPRLGTYADRMLSRLGWACEESVTINPGERCLPTDPKEIDAMIAALQAAKAARGLIEGDVELAGSAVCDG
jgi:hypothetical protein